MNQHGEVVVEFEFEFEFFRTFMICRRSAPEAQRLFRDPLTAWTVGPG